MEELSVYRYRIGVFVSVAYKKSPSSKKSKCSRRSSSTSKRKIKSKKKSKVTFVTQDERHQPSRFGFLLLLVLIPVLCLNKDKSCCHSFSIKVYNQLHDNVLFPEQTDINSCLEKHSNYVDSFNTSARCCHDLDKTQEPSVHTRSLNGHIHWYEWFTNTVLYSFKGFENYDIKTNLSEKVSDTLIGIPLRNVYNISFRWKLIFYHHNLTVLVCIILLCSLGTCSYLLGNKGVHCYNGNPNDREESRKPGIYIFLY